MTTDSTPPYKRSESAPFIYFDIAATYGIMNGAVQIELASRVLIPADGDSVSPEFIETAHLRCSPVAAATLRDALNKALEMLEQPAADKKAGANRLN